MRHLLVIAAVVAGAALAVGATSGAAGTEKKGPKLAPSRQLEGTWLSRVTLESAPPGAETSFQALNTFAARGRLLVSSSQTLPATRSLAHGEWVHLGGRGYASTFVAFRFDATGKYVGTLRVRRELTLAPSLDAFESTDVVEFVAPDGTVVASIRATESATRITAT
jgi:hypothetical protein